MTRTTAVEVLTDYRHMLLHELSKAPSSALDWQATPRSLTIGTLILHIAVVELAVVMIGSCQSGQSINSNHYEAWEKTKPGLAYQLNWPQIQGKHYEFYIEALAQVREETIKAIQDGTLLAVNRIDLMPCGDELGLQPEQVYSLNAQMKNSLPLTNGISETIIYGLVGHESYHRGHISLTNYLFGQSATGK